MNMRLSRLQFPWHSFQSIATTQSLLFLNSLSRFLKCEVSLITAPNLMTIMGIVQMTLAGSLACKQGFLLLFNTLVAQMVKNPPACRRPGFDPWVGKIPWRRAREPTPVFLPGESHGQRSLGTTCKELDTTERLSREQHTPHHHFSMPRSLRGGFSHFRSCLQLSTSKPLFIQLPAPPHKNTPTHYNCASCHFTQTIPP